MPPKEKEGPPRRGPKTKKKSRLPTRYRVEAYFKD